MPGTRRRFAVIIAFLLGWGAVVVGRLVQVQLLRHDDYLNRAQKQQERTVELTPVRGSIFDVRGRVLAESIIADSIYADPQSIEDPDDAARRLASIKGLGVDRKDLARRLRGRGEFAWIARQVTPEVSEAVAELRLQGVHRLTEHRRSYPKGELAANVMGYVGIDGEGLGGLEHSLDSWVRGRPGRVTLLRDARKEMYQVGGEGSNAPADGMNVVLTIDEVIQFITERAVEKAVRDQRATSGVAIVMDPRTGDILAMASVPTFDPNHYGDASPAQWRNRAVQDIYEPGSTFKIVTASAGLEEGLITPSQIVDCGAGSIQVASVRIREHGGNAYGRMPFEDVMVHSSNVGIIKVGLALGPQRLYDYIRRFGFGEDTGIDLPGESGGILRSPSHWSLVSNASMSMGQEIAATPLQVLRAMAALANGGRMVRPRIVSRVVDGAGNVVYASPPDPGVQVVSDRTAAIMNEILKAVVARGTGIHAALPDYVVAGKTGTAQKAVRGGYSADQFVASFVGYVPADRPRLAIIVVVDDPKQSEYGGTVAAPVFHDIAEAALRYLDVEPTMPARELVTSRTLLATFSQESAVPAGAAAPGMVPDLRGLDGRDAVARATAAGLRVSLTGSGRVASQSPPAGEPLPGTQRIELTLSTTTGFVP